jgi:hypothetical protein
VHLRSHRTRQRCEIRGRQATPSVRRERVGGFDVRGGWAGVRVSVDRTSVVDGGCRGRDSRRRRPSKRERLTACSVRPKIGRLPRGPARPLAPASADPPALRLSSHRLPKNGTRPPLKSRAPAEAAPRQLSETSPPTNETRRPTLDAGAQNRRPPAVERAEPYTDSGTRHTSASCYDSHRYSNPPYLIQISTSQRKSALLRRRVSARGVQRTEIRESTIEDRGTRHEKPPNRSLTRCQTADAPRWQAGTRCKRRASSRPFQRHLDRRF